MGTGPHGSLTGVPPARHRNLAVAGPEVVLDVIEGVGLDQMTKLRGRSSENREGLFLVSCSSKTIGFRTKEEPAHSGPALHPNRHPTPQVTRNRVLFTPESDAKNRAYSLLME